MLNFSLICVSLSLLCMGCDNATKKQQANQAQQEAVANDLRAMGKDMHKQHSIIDSMKWASFLKKLNCYPESW